MINKPGQAWLRLTQVVVTIVLLILLGRSIEWPNFFLLMTHVHWDLLLLSFALLLIRHLISVLRWQYLMQPNSPPYSKLLAFYGMGLLGNNFLPTGIGGDGVRVALTSRYVSLPEAIIFVGLDRIIGLTTLGVVLILGFCLGLPTGVKIVKVGLLHETWRTSLNIFFIIVLGGLLSLIGLVWILKFRRWVLSFFTGLIDPAILSPWKGRGWIRRLSGAGSLSLAAQAVHITAFWVILEGLNIHISSSVSLWLVLVGSAIVLLPISINGLGLQESAYVVVLTNYGVETTMAIGFALTVRILSVIFSLSGGLFLVGCNLTDVKNKKI